MGIVHLMTIANLSLPPLITGIRRCDTCKTPGQLTYRASGWAVLCPCPTCPAPAVPESEGNPTEMTAIRHWNWKQGGPR